MQTITGADQAANRRTLWHDPGGWLRENNFSREYWTYFTALLFFDAGFCIYFFIFNLYLLDLHFDEKFIGLVSGAMTIGSVLVMLPAGMVVKKIGVRALLVACYLSAPLIHVLRAVWIWPPAQIVLALIGGMAISSGGVCYLPTIARLTTKKNRTAAYSLIFSASLISSAVGGAVCGYLPGWLQRAGVVLPAVSVKRLILLVACGVALLAVVPVLRLRMSESQDNEATPDVVRNANAIWGFRTTMSPFLIRFLSLMSLWAIVLASFFPFGNIYLAKNLHLPLDRIGMIFSLVQVVQLCMVALTPLIFRYMGLSNGLLIIQTTAAVMLAALALIHLHSVAIGLFLLFTALQWMANPGLYDLVMSKTPDSERESAAAMMLFCNAVVSALATSAAGMLYARFGYPAPMLGVAVLALSTAVLVRLLLVPAPPRDGAAQQAAEEQPLTLVESDIE